MTDQWEDRNYWDSRYVDPPFCSIHEDEEMSWDADEGDWWCRECEYDDELTEMRKYG